MIHKMRPASILDLLDKQAETNPALPALSWRGPDGIATYSWDEYQQLVRTGALGLIELGVLPGDTVAIMAGNRPEHLIADLSSVSCAASTVSVYPTISDEQLVHILADADPKVIFVADEAQLTRLKTILSGRRWPAMIVLDAKSEDSLAAQELTWHQLVELGRASQVATHRELEERRVGISSDDIVTCIYTSGTTGLPKGVVLTHANVLWQLEAWEKMGVFRSSYRAVCYLPLAHIAERLWSLYFPLKSAGHVYFCASQSDLLDSLKSHRPSYFMGVPRVWEKLADTVRQLMQAPQFEDRAAEIERDRQALLTYWESKQQDVSIGPSLRVSATRAMEGVLAELRAELGMDKLVYPTCGAAPLPHDVKRFFASMGVTITEAYGLTETTGIATWERSDGGAIGSAGLPLPGCEIKLSDDGEVLVKSPGITPGYRNIPRSVDSGFVGEWFVTGDVGRLDDVGRLYIIDRKKEIIVSSAGKNIAPTAIESRIAVRGFVDQVLVVGEGRPYLVALMTVNHGALQEFATAHGLGESLNDLLRHPAVLADAERIVQDANEALSRPEQVKKFALLEESWTTQSGHLTPTLKLRRRVVENQHTGLVESLYADRTGRSTANA